MISVYKLPACVAYGANTYLIECDKEWAIIDPATPYFDAIICYPKFEKKLKYILLTHGHFDHICELEDWAEHADIYIGEGDVDMLTDPDKNCYRVFLETDGGYHGPVKTLKDGDELPLGNSSIKSISVPGHTPGSVAFLIENAAFVGDLVFYGGSRGRTDLPCGNHTQIMDSIRKFFAEFQGDRIYPGHGPMTKKSFEIKYYN